MKAHFFSSGVISLADGADAAAGCVMRVSAETLAQCESIRTTYEEAIQRLGEEEGLPKLGRLTSCCKGGCCLRLLQESPEDVLQMTKEAKRLKDLYETRPAHAQRSSVRKALKRMRRSGGGGRGLRGDASTKGTVTNRQTLVTRVTEEAARQDRQGYFQRTRRGWRKAYLSLMLPALLRADVCVQGCATLLHCSKKMFYQLKGGLLIELGLLQKGHHGSRSGLPSWARLAEHTCCDKRCLQAIPLRHLQEQHEKWKACIGEGCEKERFETLCEFLWDPTQGRLSSRCKESLRLQLGVTGHRVEAVRAALSSEERKAKREHGNRNERPWNAWPEERVRAVLQHFDIYTLGRPEDSTIRPVETRIRGIPDLLRHLVSKNPGLASIVKKSSYRRHVVGYLKKASAHSEVSILHCN